MKVKLGVAVTMTAALVLPIAATAGNVDKATGGGQILFASKGAGNTIAFTAQGTADAAKGEVRFIDRSGGKGREQVKYFGDVECIIVEGTVAKVAGTLRNGDSFNLYVEDTGEGQGNADPIFFDGMAADPTCEFDTPDSEDIQALARGNAQVTNGDGSTSSSSTRKRSALSYAKALRLAGLR